MGADRYTKAVLTVIAAALVWLCVKDLARPALALDGNEVVVVGMQNWKYDPFDPIPVYIVKPGEPREPDTSWQKEGRK